MRHVIRPRTSTKESVAAPRPRLKPHKKCDGQDNETIEETLIASATLPVNASGDRIGLARRPTRAICGAATDCAERGSSGTMRVREALDLTRRGAGKDSRSVVSVTRPLRLRR